MTSYIISLSDGGNFWELKNSNNHDPKGVFQTKSTLKKKKFIFFYNILYDMVWGIWNEVGVWGIGYLIFENNSTIRYQIDDHTTFHMISLIKISDIQLRSSFDDVR